MARQYQLEAYRGDNPLRFRVTSRSRGEIEHTVDLGAWGGNGACSCEHFQFRLLPKLKDREPPGTATRCSHILFARNRFCDAMIARIKAAVPATIETADDQE